MRYGYSTGEVSRLVGMSERQVRYLATKRLVLPSVKRPIGRGSGALYAFSDLMRLAVVHRLRATAGADLPLDRVQLALDALAKRAGTGHTLVMDEHGCWLEQASLNSTLESAQAVMAVSLDAVESNLRLQLNRAGLDAFEPNLAKVA